MVTPTFITGNQAKADFLAKYLGIPMSHHNVNLDEIQSLSLHEVAEHKIRQAYELLQQPVIVDDTALEFVAMGRLPGTFIKSFQEEMSYEQLCRLLDGQDRGAIARTVTAYYDGTTLKFFETAMQGTIAEHPKGDGGFGWDCIFVRDGQELTSAELDDKAYEAYYREIKGIAPLRAFFEGKW